MSTQNTQKIGVSTATIVGMNAMIGAGIFSITSLLASNVGPAGILTYVFAFVAVWFMAQSIARVAYLWPQEGSFYNYAKQWGGHKMGLLSAGAYLVGLLIAMGLLCRIGGVYLHEVFPAICAHNWGIIALVALVILNIAGVVLSEVGQYILIVCTVFPLVTATAMCLSKIDLTHITPFMPYGPMSIIQGTKVAIFGLFGFECVASLFNIVENPEKNVPKALQYSLILVGFIYLLFISSIILSIPLSTFSEGSNVTIPQALKVIFPNSRFVLTCINISILSAILGTVHSMIWSASELMLSYFGFLKSNFMQKLIKNNTINQKVTVLLCGLAIFTGFSTISNMHVFFSMTDVALIFAFITAMIPLLYKKSEWKSGQNIKTILGLITALVIFGVALQTLFHEVVTWIS